MHIPRGMDGVQKKNNFLITRKTKAIVAKDSAYYRSAILESNGEHDSIHSAEKILDYSCLLSGATLSGRRAAVKKAFNINNKIPVPVNPGQAIYMMPTCSTKSKDCVWLSYYHIDFYKGRGNTTYITFMDGSGLFVNASENSIDMQHKRTSQIIARQNRIVLFSRNYRDPFNNRPF